LDRLLWEDHFRQDSSHDFGKDILPGIIKTGKNVYAYPFSDYWVDVGTIQAYWQAHMDLLLPTPPLNLHNRNWIIHTRTEERPPVKINQGARIENSMICDGCIIEDGARVINSFLSPGVYIESGAIIDHSILLTDAYIEKGSSISYGILDKRVHIGQNCIVGGGQNGQRAISLVGKNSVIPAETIIINGAQVGADVVPADFSDKEVIPEKPIFTRRLPYEI
jgi:glucose-1-phosphate adenylyltransferase